MFTVQPDTYWHRLCSPTGVTTIFFLFLKFTRHDSWPTIHTSLFRCMRKRWPLDTQLFSFLRNTWNAEQRYTSKWLGQIEEKKWMISRLPLQRLTYQGQNTRLVKTFSPGCHPNLSIVTQAWSKTLLSSSSRWPRFTLFLWTHSHPNVRLLSWGQY